MRNWSKVLLSTVLAMLVVASGWATGTGEDSAGSGVEETVTLRVPVWPDIEPETLERIEAFQAQNPNVEFDFWRTDPGEYRSQIFVQLAGGAVVDVLSTQNNAVYADLASRGLLMPIDDMIAADNFDTSYMGPFFEGTRINGQSYGLPSGTTAWFMFYNKDIFDAAGVEYPTDGMTWEEWYDLAARVTSGSGQDKVFGAYVHTWPILWMGQAVQQGATVIDQDLSAFQNAMEFRSRLENDGIAMPYFDSIASNAHYTSAFFAGNVAMVPMGNWFIGMLWNARSEGNVDFEWDIVQMPVPDGTAPGTTWGMAGPLAIGATSEHPEVAWEYLKFVAASPTSANIAAREALLSFARTPASQELLIERVAEQGEPANVDILFDAVIYPEYPAVTDVNYMVNTIFKEEADLFFAGEQSSGDALAAIRRRLLSELD